MVESRLTRTLLRLGTGVTLAFIYLPLILIALYAFNASVTQSWPIDEYTTKWFSIAYHDEGVRQALWLSVRAALGATAVALVLGTLIYDNHGTNLPVAAAFTLVPIVVMIVYLVVARRLGAFAAL